MEPRFLIGQIVGMVAMTIMCLSYQCKKSSKVFLMQLIACFLFCTHFFLLKAYTGLILNGIEIIRAYLLLQEDKKWANSKLTIISVAILMAIGGIFAWDNWTSIFPIIAMVAGTPLLGTRNPKVIRYTGLCLISPSWLIYNITVLSIAGIITETLNISSILISFFRYKGFKDIEEQKTAQ